MVSLPCGDVSRGMFEEAVGNDKVGTFTEVQESLTVFIPFPFRPSTKAGVGVTVTSLPDLGIHIPQQRMLT